MEPERSFIYSKDVPGVQAASLVPTVRDRKPGARWWERQTHNPIICLNMKNQIQDADAQWGEGNTLDVCVWDEPGG